MHPLPLCLLLLCVLGIAPAQTADLAAPSFELDQKETAGLAMPGFAGDDEGIDPELAALKTVRVQRPEHLAGVAEARAARQAEARIWLEHAEMLRSYRERAPSPKNRREARRLEYMALLNAEKNGGEAEKERRGQLLEEIRRDTAVPAAQRCEAVARAKYFELRRQKRREARASEEKIARTSFAESRPGGANKTLSGAAPN